jgi:hypothetical protein
MKVHEEVNVPFKPVSPSCSQVSTAIRCQGENTAPNVKPRAGETNLVPKTEKAPDTGYMADISPLAFDSFHQFKHMREDTRDPQGNHDAVHKDTNDQI